MRCKNCGWPNKPNETTCVKCGAPLVSDAEEPSNVGGAYSPVNNQPGPELKKTVSENVVFGGNRPSQPNYVSGQTEPENHLEKAPKLCAKCGYPLRPDSVKCPNCKFPVGGNVTAEPRVQETPAAPASGTSSRRPTRMSNGNQDAPVYRGTVNPYMMNLEETPLFVLKPVMRTNERHELEEMEYEGKSVILNRSNTEEGNQSITSKEQALITNDNGQWYIEDKSEQKTTFVQAGRRMELHDGDLILLGNRLFEFHE